MGRQINNIIRRGNSYSVRVMIPRDLRQHYDGARERIKALGTRYPADARVKGAPVIAMFLEEFDHLRRHGTFPPAPQLIDEPDKGETSCAPLVEGDFKPSQHAQNLFQAAPTPNQIPTIMEGFDMYAADNPRGITADTFRQSKNIVQLFSEFLGQNPPVTMITKENIRRWKTALAEWPVKAGEVAELKGLPFPEALYVARELWGKGVRPTISKKTINKYLSALGGYCSWLMSATDYLTYNPVDGMYAKLDRGQRTVYPYSTDQLTAFFKTPLFTGCESHECDFKPGLKKIRDYRFWLPLISLFSGARLGEIAQLLISDIKQMHGIWVFHITREGGGDKRTKTIGSERVVPIHSMLIEIGLLDYHDEMARRGETKLFPEILPDKRGQISGYPSRWFRSYMSKNDLRVGAKHNFHSFRHTATDALRRAGFTDVQIGPLLGHASGTMTARYGVEPVGTVKQRAEMVGAISYEIDLAHLLPHVSEGIIAEAA